MEKLDKPETQKNINLNFDSGTGSGKEVLKISNLSIVVKEKVLFDNISFNLYYQEKACIIGENGAGKTTLIRNILENQTYLGSNIRVGYVPQEIVFDNPNISVLEEARKYFIGIEEHLIASLCKFLFVGENIHKKIKYLSGGEKVRLKLFCLIQDKYNFLIFDEPTNHIDINTREILENALIAFKGTLLFVSHDRYFINKIATNIIEIKNKKVNKYIGNYDDYKMIVANRNLK